MAFSLGSWRPKHLLAAWGAYWTGLAAVAITPPVRAIMRMADGTSGSGNASADFGDEGLKMVVTSHGQTVWSGSVSTLEIMLWVTLPPLLLWIAWLFARSRRGVTMPPAELRAPDGLGDLRDRRPQMPQRSER